MNKTYNQIFIFLFSIVLSYFLSCTSSDDISNVNAEPNGNQITIPDMPRDKINSNNPSIIFYNDFENDELGYPEKKDIYEDWNWNRPCWVENTSIEENRVKIVDSGDDFIGKCMQIFYPEGSESSAGNEGGAQWNANLNNIEYEELYCAYRVKFQSNFDFVKGGKLPSLAGTIVYNMAGGGSGGCGDDNWSARIMWRENGKIVQYVYHPDRPGGCEGYGEDFTWNCPSFQTGKWYLIENRVRMNTPSQKNGIIQSWINGVKVLDKQNLRFRDIDALSINYLMFSTYFGGNTPAFAASKDEYIYFDEFVISTNPISH